MGIRASIWRERKKEEREEWMREGRRERERERVNTNSSRLADIKFAFILYSVIYDTDLSRGMDVRARNCFLRVYVCTERERERERALKQTKPDEKEKERNE